MEYKNGKWHFTEHEVNTRLIAIFPKLKQQRDDLLAACKKDILTIMAMTSELNRMYTGTTIDYQWADRLKTIETASRVVTQDTKQAIAKAEKEG